MVKGVFPLDAIWYIACWLCLTSHRQRGQLETAPPFTVPCEGREASFLYRSHRESNRRLSYDTSAQLQQQLCSTRVRKLIIETCPYMLYAIYVLWRHIWPSPWEPCQRFIYVPHVTEIRSTGDFPFVWCDLNTSTGVARVEVIKRYCNSTFRARIEHGRSNRGSRGLQSVK